MASWKQPRIVKAASSTSKRQADEDMFDSGLRDSDVNDMIDYLQAFYLGMPVKRLQAPLQFSTWTEESKPSKRKGQLMKANMPIGLITGPECIRIRTRPSLDGVFTHQLNLEDLLDVCISILPSDAYALMLLVDQDMFEDEDDDFCCGRAAGGSRVAVVSTARYNPLLDAQQNIDRGHSWPASHCEAYVDRVIASAGLETSAPARNAAPNKRKRGGGTPSAGPAPTAKHSGGALRAAVEASARVVLPAQGGTAAGLRALLVGRASRTAAHELAHCLGIDHCVGAAACVMQGSASICEDARQPPYLCPVDLAKVLRATGASARERDDALRRFCARWEGVAGADMFVGLGAWLGSGLVDDGDVSSE